MGGDDEGNDGGENPKDDNEDYVDLMDDDSDGQ